MNVFFLVCFLLSLVYTTNADGNCKKNAWIKIHPSDQSFFESNVYLSGTFEITSGKGAHDISKTELSAGFVQIIDGSCWGDQANMDWGCNIDKSKAWNSLAWVGTANIEFDCWGKVAHVYDVNWVRT